MYGDFDAWGIKTLTMKEIENKIENLIAKSDNDELMAAWLEYLEQKNKNSERLVKRLEDKDPILTGAIVGAIIGSLFDK